MKTIKITEEHYNSLKAISKSRKAAGINQSIQDTIDSIMEHSIEIEIEGMSEEELEIYTSEKKSLNMRFVREPFKNVTKEMQRLTDVVRKSESK